MNQTELIDLAGKLSNANQEAVNEYENKMDLLVSIVNKKMLDRPDINDIVGDANFEMMKNNHSNHARFVISILGNINPEELVTTVIWVFKTYQSRGFHPSYWVAQLNTWLEVLEEQMSELSFKQITPLYNWFITNIPSFSALSEKLEDEN